MKKPIDRNTSRHRMAILMAICLAALVLPLSFSGGAVATPAIGRELGGSAVAMNWITNAFMLTFGSLLMAAGALADQFGRKRLFVSGLVGFVACSLALGFAQSILTIDLLRAVQGVFAAGVLAGGTAALAQEFDGPARTRAFSLLGTTFGLGLAFGPVLAGLLITYLGWRTIFLVCAAVGIFALLFGVPRMRESRDPGAQGFDGIGTLTFTGALTCFTSGVIAAPESGWRSPVVVALLIVSVVLLAIFVMAENRVSRPMLDLSLFRYPRFIGVQLLPIATCCCYIVLIVVLPRRFIGIDGYSEIEAGALMLALSAPMLVVPFLASWLTRWWSAGVISTMGLVTAAGGLIWLSLMFANDDHTATIVPMLIIGVGAALPWGLMDGLSVSVVPKERAGMATGIFSTTRVASEGVALAIVSAILAALTQQNLQADLGAGKATSVVTEAAARLAAGDLLRASTLLPDMARITIQQGYGHAFDTLLYGLAVFTLLCAVVIYACLARANREQTAERQAAAHY